MIFLKLNKKEKREKGKKYLNDNTHTHNGVKIYFEK